MDDRISGTRNAEAESIERALKLASICDIMVLAGRRSWPATDIESWVYGLLTGAISAPTEDPSESERLKKESGRRTPTGNAQVGTIISDPGVPTMWCLY